MRMSILPKSSRICAPVHLRVIYCGDNLEQLRKLPDACVDLIYIDPPFNSNRNYEVFWGETKEKRAFEDRHASTKAYIDYMRPRCVELRPRAQENRQLLLPLRLARQPLRQGHARSDFRRESISKTRSSGSAARPQRFEAVRREPRHDPFLHRGKNGRGTSFLPYSEDTSNKTIARTP